MGDAQAPARTHPGGRLGRLLMLVLLAGILAVATALLVVPTVTGSTPLVVVTGSMRPAYPPGSVVVVRPVPPSELVVGDTVTYQRLGHVTPVTHRIVEVTTSPDGGRWFVTRGDANPVADPLPVGEGQVLGRVWYAVPLVGYATTLTSGQRELALLVGGFLLLAWIGYRLVVVVRDRRAPLESDRRLGAG